ncbi:MAG: hypothetical protein JW787_08175 [Sedimentisphaerales bacterium]|nr:hypothetical protein [Sedimentisphaerales bacterium]
MFDFAQQPWTLLGIAVIVLFGIFTYRSVVPEKNRWRQFLIPLIIAAAAFGIDTLVQTDKEKIEAVLDAGIKAVEEENFSDIELYISDDYRDSFHASKQQLIDHAQRELDMNMVETSKRTDLLFDNISENKAKVNLFMQIILSKNSPISQAYPVPFFKLRVDINFIKQNNNWLINNIEINSVNQQSARWNQIR